MAADGEAHRRAGERRHRPRRGRPAVETRSSNEKFWILTNEHSATRITEQRLEWMRGGRRRAPRSTSNRNLASAATS